MTFAMQRARGDFGVVPVAVLEALVVSSREDLGHAYRRLDYAHQLSPSADGLGDRRVRLWLGEVGLTPAEVDVVAEWVAAS